MPPGKVLLCPCSHPRLGVHPVLCFRSLVDTVYALKDEVQELRQVSHSQPVDLVFKGGEGETTTCKLRPFV